MCIIQRNYQHKRNKKDRIPFVFQHWKQKKKIYQSKWRQTHEKLPIEKS